MIGKKTVDRNRGGGGGGAHKGMKTISDSEDGLSWGYEEVQEGVILVTSNIQQSSEDKGRRATR